MTVSKSRCDSPLISIIVPCHNVAETILGTVRSATRQVYRNLEILCVENGSSDQTVSILHALADEDCRVRVIQLQNAVGLGSARNAGLNAANGEYVAFLDGDDHLEPDFVSELLDALVRENADIAQCAIRYVFEDRDFNAVSPAGLIKGEHCHYRLDLDDGLPFVFPQMWNKIYKKTLLEGLTIKDIIWEDAHIMPYILNKCRTIVNIPISLINYNKRFSKITGTEYSDLSRSSRYFSSSLDTIRAIANIDFVAARRKWLAPMPRCAHQNISNYLRSSEKELQSVNRVAQKDFSKELSSYLSDLRSIFNQEDYIEFSKYAHIPRNMERAGNNIASHAPDKTGAHPNRILHWFERKMPIFDRMFPKRQDLWVFANWGHYGRHTMDNPRAIFEAIKDDPTSHKVVLFNDAIDPETAVTDGENIEFLPLKSFRGLSHLIRAGQIVIGYSIHSMFGYRRLVGHPDRRIIQAWHGIPIKKVGLAVSDNKEEYWDEEAPRYHIIPSSSEVDRETMIRSFSPDHPEKVVISGLPRHDFLAMQDDGLPRDYREHTATLQTRLQGRRLVLFAPTWRENPEDRIQFNLDELKQLDALFARANAVIGFRMHRNMVRHGMSFPLISDNVIQLTDIPDVNIILRQCGAVITDYSSIYLDIMAMRKPAFLYTPDIERYDRERGFNYVSQEFTPHCDPIVSFDKLLTELETLLAGKWAPDQAYQAVYDRFHLWGADGGAARRFIEAANA